jgi:uncharacterized protein (DUF362 family)
MSVRSTVSIVKCADYARELPEALDKLLSHLGGITSFVKPGQSVVLKPNLLSDHTPDEAVTTHPELVRALIRTLKQRGVSPVVADSPANVVKLERVWERTGFSSMCAEEDVPLLNLEECGSTAFNVDGFSFSIAKPLLDADVIISVPKVKTHVLTVLTAAVKNMYGAVPGFQKTMLHKLHPTPSEFGALMAAIYEKIPPTLSIADAVYGMDGDGPSAGRTIHMGFLAASSDAVALDMTLCRILKIKPDAVPYLAPYLKGEEQRIINVAGENPDTVMPGSFRAPSTLRMRLIPRPLVRLLAPLVWIRPSISDKCVVCGRCVKACPVQALSITNGQKPVLDSGRCIGCCCCHEICPERAVAMAQSPFLAFVRKGKMP